MTQEIGNQTEPPPLTQTYHKARRALVFLGAVLIFWEYVDLNIPNKIQFIGTESEFSLGHPEVAPVVIAFFIFYFGFRLIIERLQCPQKRRDMLPSKLDFFAALGIGGLALLVFAIQMASPQRIATIITPNVFLYSALGLGTGFFLFNFIGSLIFRFRSGIISSLIIIVVSSVILVIVHVPFWTSPVYFGSLAFSFLGVTIFLLRGIRKIQLSPGFRIGKTFQSLFSIVEGLTKSLARETNEKTDPKSDN